MKKIFITAAMLVGLHAFSQNVGINTTSPAATLDVTGKPATTTVLDGLIAPRITTAQLSAKSYTAAQNGALVYVTDTAAGTNQAVNVTAPGYYYFSGTAMQWVALASSSTVNSLEPWYNQATGTAATANTQNIYQKGKVSVGANASNGILSVYSTTAGVQDNSLFYAQGLPNTTTPLLNSAQYFNFIGNLKAGDFTYLSNAGDQALVFDVGNGGSPYLNTGFIISPHVNGGRGVPYGIKITEQGFTSVNAVNPTETFQVNGTARLVLPANGAANAIYTTPGGANSLGASIATIPAPTQTFTAANTVVSDANGVLGYVTGLPPSAGTFASQDLTTNGTTVSATDGILTVSAGPVASGLQTNGQVNMALTTGSSWAIISTTGGDNQTTGQTNYWRGTLSTTVSTNVGPNYQASNSGLYRMTVMLNDTKQVYDVVVSWNSQSGTSAPYRFNVYVKQLH